MIDKLFKIGLLVIGVILLIVLYKISQNNRFYQNQDAIFDTRTGKIYVPDKEEQKWTVADPISGKIMEIPFKREK